MKEKDHEEADDEAKTPRVSGTLERAPIYLGMAENLINRLSQAFYEYSKNYFKLNIKLAKRCRLLEAECRDIHHKICEWSRKDPGPDARRDTVMRLLDIESEANEIAPVKLDRV